MKRDAARLTRCGSSRSRSTWTWWRTLFLVNGPACGQSASAISSLVDPAVSLADQVLEQLPGALIEPFAAQVPPPGLDPRRAQNVDSKRGSGGGLSGLGLPAPRDAVIVRAQVDDDPRLGHVDRGRGHPHGRGAAVTAHLEPGLRERFARAHRAPRQAPRFGVGWTASRDRIADQLAAGQPRADGRTLAHAQQRGGPLVGAQHFAQAVEQHESEGRVAEGPQLGKSARIGLRRAAPSSRTGWLGTGSGLLRAG